VCRECTHPSEKYAIFNIAESRIFISKCTKIVCGRALPGLSGGAYSTPPEPLAAFDGPTSKRGEGWGGEERCYAPSMEIPSYATVGVSVKVRIRSVVEFSLSIRLGFRVSVRIGFKPGSTKIYVAMCQGKRRVRDEKSLQLVAKLMSLLLQIRVHYI